MTPSMNAHNELHDPASPVVKQNLTTQPAAAQEADGARARLHEIAYRDTAVSVTVRADDLRAILAAPVTAAPADAEEDAYVIDQMGKLLAEIAVIVNGPEPAGTRWSYHDLPAKVKALASTPAAPGIDLEPLIAIRNRLHQMSTASDLGEVWADVVIELMGDVQKLIDASPQGALNEQFGSAEGLDSPKGGSDARDAARYRWLRESRGTTWDQPWVAVGHYGRPYDQQPNEIEGKQLDDAIDAAMQAQAGDAEVQP